MIPFLLLAAQLVFADHYLRGMELARAGLWSEARAEFLAGRREFPSDKRFALELAGIEYRLGNADAARQQLQAALRLDTGDAYANDFLGTLYFLDGNYEAALRYWNRIGKPRIAEIELSPPPPIRPVVLDHALAFAPGDVLTLDRYRSTLVWLSELDTLEGLRAELAAREDDTFDATFRWRQSPAWIRAATASGGLPYQTLEGRFTNLGGEAMTAAALYRFDAQKRRLALSFASPLHGSPKVRYAVYADGRSETWNFRQPTDFRVRKIEGGARLRFVPSGRFSWETGVSLADRSFPGAPQFASGFSVKHSAGFRYRFMDLPEHRLTADLQGTWETGHLFAGASGGVYSRSEWSARGRWLPRPRGSDYEVLARVGFGTAFGRPPLDDLFMLTSDRDYDLPLRGHPGTIGGKRGSAPLGRRYVLGNFDFYKQIWRAPLVTLDAGPVVDVGRIWQSVTPYQTGKLLVDAGAQVRLRLPGGFQVVLSYARDLRGGTGDFNSFMR